MKAAWLVLLSSLTLPVIGTGQAADTVKIIRLPAGALQPQVAVDSQGRTHVVYFKGEPGDGDLFYVRVDEAGTFSAPIRVNSEPGSAIATGNVRGAQIAVGRDGRVHVVWNGSSRAIPRAPDGSTPMLYARTNPARTSFESQRNLIKAAVGLDGGGAITSDSKGHVYVFWHAGGPTSKGEGDRRVWLATSADDGKTFGAERPISDPATGACGCCGMAAVVDARGGLSVLYRSATDMVHRDTFLLTSPAGATTFTSTKLQEWNIGACPMSTFALAPAGTDLLAAWETAGQVQFARITGETNTSMARIEAPGASRGRKHPVLAINRRGEILLAWTEGMGWQRGGSVAWQVFDAAGRPIGSGDRAAGVPTWGLVGAFARSDGGFSIVY